jgi:hypothetical protein
MEAGSFTGVELGKLSHASHRKIDNLRVFYNEEVQLIDRIDRRSCGGLSIGSRVLTDLHR